MDVRATGRRFLDFETFLLTFMLGFSFLLLYNMDLGQDVRGSLCLSF